VEWLEHHVERRRQNELRHDWDLLEFLPVGHVLLNGKGSLGLEFVKQQNVERPSHIAFVECLGPALLEKTLNCFIVVAVHGGPEWLPNALGLISSYNLLLAL